MASIKFDITGNANGFIRATKQATDASKGMVSSIQKEAREMDNIFKTLATGAGTFFTMQMASGFVKQVSQVRGEFQQLEVAFETMLQSKEKADALMAQVVDTAARTPFDLQGVANGAKQLLAYGVASEEVNDTLVRLGDIAAGLSIPLNDLVYLYGTTMTQGRLFTQDLRQFQGRGIPLADELAKQFGVTKDAVGELVTAGKVGFAEVQKAIMNMTNEGGKFNNLMEKQSKTITGQISNLEDAVDQMFNEIGKSSEGAISEAIGMASSLVEHYDKVGKIIGGIVVTLGSYKAATIAINTYKKASIALETADAVAKRASAASTKQVTTATVLLAKAQKALNLSMLSNPYVIAAAAVAALGLGVYALVTAKSKEERIHERVNSQLERYNENLDKQKQQLQELYDTISDSSSTDMQRAIAMDKLRELYPAILKDLSDEEILKLGVAEATKRLNEENDKLIRNDLQAQILKTTKAYEDAVEKLNAYRATGSKAGLLGKGEGKRLSRDVENYRYELEALLSAYKKIDDAAQKAEFLALPADQKIVSLKQSNAELDEEITELDKKLAELRKKKNQAKGDEPTEFALGSLSGALYEGGMTEEELLEEIRKKREQQKANEKDIEDNQKKIDEQNKALTDKQRKAAYDRKKAEQKAAEDLANMKVDLNNRIAQADIDSMEDGYNKVIKQLEHNLDLEEQAIEQKKKDLLKKKENDALQNWLAEDPENRKAYDFKYKAELTPEELEMFRQMGDLAQRQFNKGREDADKKFEHEASFFKRELEISAMTEGAEKDKAQRELENEKQVHQLELQRDAYIEAARAAYLFAEQKKAADDPFHVFELFDVDKANAEFDAIIEKYKKKQKDQQTQELLRKYEDYTQGVQRIEKALNEDLAQMVDESGNLQNGFTQKNVDIAKKQAEEAKDALAISFVENTESFNVFVQSLADKTLKELMVMLDKAETELSNLSAGVANPDELARARAEVAKLKAQIANVKVDQGVKEASVSWADLNRVLNEVASQFSELGDIIPGIAGEVLSGIGQIASASVSMANGIGAIGEAVSAAEKASAILAVIAAAIKVISYFTNVASENEEANNKAAAAARNYAESLEDINEQLAIAKNSTLFGENVFGILAANADKAIKSITDLRDLIKKGVVVEEGMEYIDPSWININNTNDPNGVLSAPVIDDDWLLKQTVELKKYGQTLGSDLRSGWQKFWSSDKNKSTFDLSQLVNEGPAFNISQLINEDKFAEFEAWYQEWGEGLSDENKAIAEQILKEWEDYQEAMAEIKENVKSFFSSVSSDVVDSMLETWIDTGDAIANATELVGDYAKALAKSAAESLLLEKVFSGAEEQMLQFMMSGDTAGAAALIKSLVEKANQYGENIANIFAVIDEVTGGSITYNPEESSREALAKGTVQASQDSIDHLMGIATNVQSHTFSIHNDIKQVVNINSQILSSVRSIEGNTDRLSQMEAYLLSMKSDLEDMATKGIKVK